MGSEMCIRDRPTPLNPPPPVPTCECTSAYGDDGKYGKYGCVISKPSPSNYYNYQGLQLMACKCVFNADTKECSGTVVPCPLSDPYNDPASGKFCWTPDTSIASCYLGNGNCDGYNDTCACVNYDDNKNNGCLISAAAPPGTACTCFRDDAKGTCRGHVGRCKDENSHYCWHPDTSRMSCMQGQGFDMSDFGLYWTPDCSGYDHKH